MARRNGRGQASASTGGVSMSNASLYAAQLDGPGSAAGSNVSDARGRPSSNAPNIQSGSQVGSRHGSMAGSVRPRVEIPRNLDLGPDAFALASTYQNKISLPRRPGFNPSGRQCNVELNSYQVLAQPNKTVYQYDVYIGNGAEKRALIKAVWESRKAQELLGSNGLWIFDGNRIAWSIRSNLSLNHDIDMDLERGRDSRGDNIFRLRLRQVSQINLTLLQHYLDGKTDFDNSVLESINFIDQLLRHTPSKNLLAIKRSFFDKPLDPDKVQWLGQCAVAAKGVYQSLRFGQGAANGAANGAKLVVNADVANTCFFLEMTLADAICQMAHPAQPESIVAAIRPKAGSVGGVVGDTGCYVQLKKLNKLRFKVRYGKQSEAIRNKVFQVKRITYTPPRETKFRIRDKKSGREWETNVLEYFRNTYSVSLKFPYLPCVETMKGAMYPAELCWLLPAQRYPFKLTELQTTNMIRFAVTRPKERAGAIANGLKALNWSADPMLSSYGLKINPHMTRTNARLLQPPLVEFGQGKTEDPKTSGRWRIDGKKFIQPNSRLLRKWTWVILNDWGRDKIAMDQVRRFMNEFVTLYRGYGGNVDTTNLPEIIEGSMNNLTDCLESVYGKLLRMGNRNERPQMIVFVVNGKITASYNRVKKNCDCRYGLVSQVMQSAHVKKCSAQYIGNVLMKVNAKLGGFSFRALPVGKPAGTGATHFKRPTMIIGADVSHASAGSLQPSMAAITVSMDKFGGRYLAACQSNGHRVEMISSWNIDDMLRPVFREWSSHVAGGKLPQHVIMIRDGVSEGQFEHVLQQEVKDIRNVFATLAQGDGEAVARKIQFTVLVASKRHHIRFFPAAGHGDRNFNPFPGTLVERDVTHPFQWDFYLCSHTAIQGTARPVHYHVIMDEANMQPQELINMIYEQCYSYVRSSTPVSIHPAVYYAHLAAKRAVAHERGTDVATGGRKHDKNEIEEVERLVNARLQAEQTGKILSSTAKKRLQELTNLEYPPLIPMNPENRIQATMWFV